MRRDYGGAVTRRNEMDPFDFVCFSPPPSPPRSPFPADFYYGKWMHPASYTRTKNDLLDGSVEGATAFLVDRIIRNKNRMPDTVQRLRSMRFEDILDELERTIFRSVWPISLGVTRERLGSKVSGRTFEDHEGPVISLNTDVLHSASKDQHLATLFHHMIHAFILGHTHPGKSLGTSEDEGRFAHEKAFGSILHALKEASSTGKDSQLPLSFGHTLQNNSKSVHFGPLTMWNPLDGRPPTPGSPYGPGHLHTSCTSDVKFVDKKDCEKWFNEKCQPLLNQVYIYKITPDNELQQVERRQLNESEYEFVEFAWDKKNIYVPRRIIGKYSSTLGKQFSEKRTLSIPSWVKKDIFNALYSFLTNDGDYKPKVSDAQEQNDDDKARAGQFRAPEMRETKKDWPAYMLTDIRMYNLGKTLKFDELSKAAMKRLESLHFTHEDVVAALAEIYAPPKDKEKDKDKDKEKDSSSSGGKEPSGPPDALRSFARNFFKRNSPNASALRGQHPYQSSNLNRLDTGEFKHSWMRLIERGIPALIEDFLRAKAEMFAGNFNFSTPSTPACSTPGGGGWAFSPIAQMQRQMPLTGWPSNNQLAQWGMQMPMNIMPGANMGFAGYQSPIASPALMPQAMGMDVSGMALSNVGGAAQMWQRPWFHNGPGWM